MYDEKITEEQNPASLGIDKKSTIEILNIINKEDATVSQAVNKSLDKIHLFIDELFIRIKEGGRLIYVGSGTSGRLGVLDAVECPPTYRTDPNLIQGVIAGGYNALVSSIEGAEDNPIDGAREMVNRKLNYNDTVVGITASSSTPFVLGAMEEASKIGSLTAKSQVIFSFSVNFCIFVI